MISDSSVTKDNSNSSDPGAAIRWSLILHPGHCSQLLLMTSILLIPLAFHSQTSHSIVLKDFFAAWFALWFVLLGGSYIVLSGIATRIPKSFWIPFLGYLIYGSIRCFTSSYAEHSWESWRLSLVGFSPLVPCLMLAKRRRGFQKTFLTLVVSTSVVCGYGVLQFMAELAGVKAFDPVHWSWNRLPIFKQVLSFLDRTDLETFAWESFEGFGTLPGVCSTLGNPNFLAGFLVPVFAFGLASAIGLWRRSTSGFLLSILLVIGTSCGLAAAGSHGGILGLFGGISCIFLFAGRSWGWRDKNGRWLILSAIGLVFATFAGLFILFNTSKLRPPGGGAGIVENRSIVYRCTAWMIGDHFLFGVSPGNFTIRFPDYLSGPRAEEYGWLQAPEEKVLEHAHSEPLEVFADLGLIGFLLWAAFLAGWGSWVWKGWKKLPEGTPRWVLTGFIAGVTGAFFQNLHSVSLRWMAGAWIFWGFVGAAGGWVLHHEPFGERARRIGGRWLWMSLPIAILLVPFLFVPTAKRLSADFRFTKGREALMTGDPSAEENLRRAIELNPAYAQAYYLLGGLQFSNGDYRSAIQSYQRLRSLRGNVVVLTENLGTTYFKLATTLKNASEKRDALLEAVRLYEDSLERHPSFPRLEDYLARAYESLGKKRLARMHRKRAIDLYEKWFEWDSSYPRPQYALDLGKNYYLEGEYEKAFWQLRNAKRWGSDQERVETLKQALIKKAPELETLWDREERKERGGE